MHCSNQFVCMSPGCSSVCCTSYDFISVGNSQRLHWQEGKPSLRHPQCNSNVLMYRHVLTDCNAGAACAYGGQHLSVYIYRGSRFGAKLQYCNPVSLHWGPLHFQYWSVRPYAQSCCLKFIQLCLACSTLAQVTEGYSHVTAWLLFLIMPHVTTPCSPLSIWIVYLDWLRQA